MMPAATAGKALALWVQAGAGPGSGAGGLAGPAMVSSSYTRPVSSFGSEDAGAASYAKPGAARVGAAAAPVSGGPMAAPAGMLHSGATGRGSGKDNESKTVRLRAAPVE